MSEYHDPTTPTAAPTAQLAAQPMVDTAEHAARLLHPVNVAHLVMGIAFLGVALIALLVQGDVVDTHDLRWLLPVPWIAGGAAGLIASAVRAVRPAPPAAPDPADR